MFIIELAKLKIKINNKYQFVFTLCKDYIIDCNTYDFEIDATDEEIILEHNESLPIDYPLDYCESIVIYRKIALKLYKYNAFVLHGATLSIDNNGYIFLAKSGVGKTTHINLYMKHFSKRAMIINGDKPIIRLIDDKLYAFGTPYNGKERLGCNSSVEIKGLCFIKRGIKNTAYQIDKDEASTLIFNQILLPNNQFDYDILITLIDKMLSTCKIIQLECNMDEEACKVSFEALGGKNYEN